MLLNPRVDTPVNLEYLIEDKRKPHNKGFRFVFIFLSMC